MTSQTDTPVKKKRGFPWYGFFAGGVLYTVFAIVLFVDSSMPILAWICAISAPLGFYYAWGAWKKEKRERGNA